MPLSVESVASERPQLQRTPMIVVITKPLSLCKIPRPALKTQSATAKKARGKPLQQMRTRRLQRSRRSFCSRSTLQPSRFYGGDDRQS